jgi:hypothetical protein
MKGFGGSIAAMAAGEKKRGASRNGGLLAWKALNGWGSEAAKN